MPEIDDSPLDAPESSPEPAQGISDVASIVEQAQAPLLVQMETLVATQQRTDQQVQQLLEAVSKSHQPEPASAESTDFMTEFTTGDPRSVVAQVVRDEMAAFAPFLSKVAGSASNAFTMLEAQRIDDQFGDGAWEKHFAKPVEQIMEMHRKGNPTALVDSDALRSEVNGLAGALFDELVEFRSHSRTKASESANEDLASLKDGIQTEIIQRVNSSGGLRRVSTGGQEITDDLKGYLEGRGRALGKVIEPKQWLEERDYGNNLDDYRAHKKKLKAANGADN